jgi:hypothetical protein
MPIANNIASAVGDVFTIEFEPIVGALSINYFSTTSENENLERYFLREFRYSTKDGLFFSDWLQFTDNTPVGVTFTEAQVLWIETRYTREGAEGGTLKLTSSDLQVNYGVMNITNAPVGTLFFGELANYNPEILILARNILQKLYQRGIVPLEIIRGEGENEDADYLSFWRAFSMLLAMQFTKAKQDIQSFVFDEEFLSEYLAQNNAFFDTASHDLLQKRFIMSNQIREVKKRGTELVFKQGDTINGEFLRMIGLKPTDEFLYWLNRNENRGWVLGQNSPCYRGFGGRHISKIKTSDLIPETNAPYDANYSTLTFEGKEAIYVGMSASGKGALNYYENGVSPIPENLTIIDENVDYRLDFLVATTNASQKCSFYLHTFDKDFNYREGYAVNTGGAGVFNGGFEFYLPSPLKYYFFSVFLYNAKRNNLNPKEPSIGTGSHFFTRTGTKYILPSLVFDSMGANESYYVADFSLKLLANGACVDYVDGLGSSSACFLNSNNILNIIARNNNGALSRDALIDNTKRFLIPYNAHLDFYLLNRLVPIVNFGVTPENTILGDFNSDFNNDFA